MCVIFSEQRATEFQHDLMSFSGTTVIKSFKDETPSELFTLNFDILIFIYVRVKIVCS